MVFWEFDFNMIEKFSILRAFDNDKKVYFEAFSFGNDKNVWISWQSFIFL